jgi:hypothetical protein
MSTAGQKPRKRPSERSRVKSRAKMNALQRFQRGRQIAAMRSRVIEGELKPVAWKTIAAELGMSQSGAQDAYDQYLAAEAAEHENPLGAVMENVDLMKVAIHELLITYERAEEGSPTRVQALRAAVEVAEKKLIVMQRAGLAPRQLTAPGIEQRVATIFREFAEMLDDHDVSDEVIVAFIEMADRNMGRMPDIDGRVVNALPQ